MLNDYKCQVCGTVFELFQRKLDTFVCDCGADHSKLSKIFSKLNVNASDGKFDSRVPSSFKNLIDTIHHKAGASKRFGVSEI